LTTDSTTSKFEGTTVITAFLFLIDTTVSKQAHQSYLHQVFLMVWCKNVVTQTELRTCYGSVASINSYIALASTHVFHIKSISMCLLTAYPTLFNASIQW